MTIPPVPGRIRSIDALRGFDMFWITGGDWIFVSLFTLLGGPVFTSLALHLEHPEWAGFRFYDLIFPLFLFIMGLSLPFSVTRRLEKGSTKREILKHVVRRTVILYFLGLVCNGFFDLDFAHLRYTGVLHRIAFTYLFTSLIVLYSSRRGQWAWTLALVAGYWLVLLLVPVPGFGAYNLTPEGNLAGYIDRLYLPGSFCCYPFGDNEGLLTNFAAIVTPLTGVLAGYRLQKAEPAKAKLLALAGTGAALVVLGILWNFVYPVNKYLWTGSYVAVTTGLSLLAFSLFYWLIDVKGLTRWAFPFTVIGMNCITIYVLQAVFDFGVVARIFIHGFVDHLGNGRDLFTALCVFAVKWAFLWFLYRRRWFLKV